MSGLRILGIDPGNTKSGFVLVEAGEHDITKVIDCGKVDNIDIFGVIACAEADCAIEMVAGMGMPVGQEVFDTCFWIGRFWEMAGRSDGAKKLTKIYRREEKLYLCGTLTAKDKNIRQALVDRYAPGEPNFGKGTAKNPGFFFGFSADVWQAMAVAATYYDKYIKGLTL